jgi:hypothetical protein
MSKATASNWYFRFILAWVSQDEADSDEVEQDLISATFERCLVEQERCMHDFSMDAIEYLGKASRRLASRLFSGANVVTRGATANIPVAFPFLNKNVLRIYVADAGDTCQPIDIALRGGAGSRVDVTLEDGATRLSLYQHLTVEERRLSVGNKVAEAIAEAVGLARKRDRTEEKAAVRELSELLESRDRGHDQAEARLVFRRLVNLTSVRDFVDYWYDEPQYLDDNPELFPPVQVAERRRELNGMNEAAVRRAKYRALDRMKEALSK